MSQGLLLLLVGVPPEPSSLRVKVWRRLKGLGAVALKRSAYLLPDDPDRYEDFQWLAQEIQREGGDATLIRVQQIENVGDAEIYRLFHEPRDQDYRQLALRYRKLLQSLDRKKGAATARVEDELTKLARDHQRIRDIDFFDAPGGAEVRRLEEAIAMRVRRPEAPRPARRPTLDLSTVRGRRWVTRPRPHVDRIASAWLIRRFIDPQAEFVFAPPAEFPADAIPYDAPGVELSHDGEDCTFETLIKRANLRDRRLKRLAEVVHEADLRDGKYAHEEARGIDVAIRALLAASPDDQQVLAQGMALFEGLYATTRGRS
ncbi:MAG TPA: chromate resistance protein ChrB domain-containing protein [Terriglobales bacterium]|nr:chromate resistance protein ChrB domain-containing protein [Terriglobales bacterium]